MNIVDCRSSFDVVSWVINRDISTAYCYSSVWGQLQLSACRLIKWKGLLWLVEIDWRKRRFLQIWFSTLVSYRWVSWSCASTPSKSQQNLTSSILKVTEQFFKNEEKNLYIFFLITVRPRVSFEFIESIIFSWGIFLGRFSVVTTIKTASKYKPSLLQCMGGSYAFTRGVGTGTFQWEWNFTDAKPVSWKTLFYAFFCNVPHNDIPMPYKFSTMCFLAAL